MNDALLNEKLKGIAYKLGYLVWGDKSGGAMTTNLLKRQGYWDAIDALCAALKAADPRDYMGGVLRKASNGLNNQTAIGTRMGKYEWDGSKWKAIE